ncbi:hypothetical protein PMI14_05843 [Acidovorax sp. CF316]|uniref:hypothetical protein n=1 Tax=Acidovorax sp. CF316 TaxID=1144317 RepID=UPI00026BC803|nr:hypothetical protein [Acidovorax sp. CF316]EJE49600.1 hypothetical protein PMI14_05843 [Acidovorax sp. CF316]
MTPYIAQTARAKPVGTPMVGRYHCPELQAQPGRAQGTQAAALPSRRGNRLYHPCGRVTDLAGLPITTTEPTP